MAERPALPKVLRLRVLRIALTLVVAGFVCSAIYISSLLVQRQSALDYVGRGNVTWMVWQGVSEFGRLELRVSEYGMGVRPVDAAEVKLRFDIVVNRLKTLESKGISRFIAASPRNSEVLAQLRQALEEARPLVDRIDVPGNPARILDLLSPIYPRLVRLSYDATSWNAAKTSEERQDLIQLQWVFAIVAFGLILCGVVLIVLLLLHNRLLTRTHAKLRLQDSTLQTQNQRFDAALNNMSQGLCLMDSEQRLIVCNKRFLDLFGLPADTPWQGAQLETLIRPEMLPSTDMTFDAGWTDGSDAEAINARTFGDRTHRMPDGRVMLVSHQPMTGGGWVSTFEDVTERRRAQDRIVHMAHHDALTGMPNRLLFWESTAVAIQRLKSSGQPFAILYLDLDRFKEVNDTAGHPAGDALLQTVAERLRAIAPAPAMVARLGGDEFAVLHPYDGDTLTSVTDLAKGLLYAISLPYLVGNAEILVSTSIGIALAPKDGDTTDELMKNADLALYRAKEVGANTYQFFDPAIEAKLQLRRSLEIDLRRGLELGQFDLHYQPLMSLKSNQVVCGEALMRWNHPTRGPISPAEFIPLAEETGFIDALGEWALQRACRDAARWPNGVRVAVNLSPLQFRGSSLPQKVEKALAASGLEAHRLELEITESVLLQNNAANLNALRRLHSLGVSIALDDFGTGYSSLSYLQLFPFDKIKIDQTFVRNAGDRESSLAIIQSIASLGNRLNIVTTAEGVETLEHLNMVITAGCTEAQGFYFNRALPEAAFRSLLHDDIEATAPIAQVRRA